MSWQGQNNSANDSFKQQILLSEMCSMEDTDRFLNVLGSFSVDLQTSFISAPSLLLHQVLDRYMDGYRGQDAHDKAYGFIVEAYQKRIHPEVRETAMRTQDDNGNTLLHMAISMRNAPLVEFLLWRTPHNIASRNLPSVTPITQILRSGDQELLDLLFRSGGSLLFLIEEYCALADRQEHINAEEHYSEFWTKSKTTYYSIRRICQLHQQSHGHNWMDYEMGPLVTFASSNGNNQRFEFHWTINRGDRIMMFFSYLSWDNHQGTFAVLDKEVGLEKNPSLHTFNLHRSCTSEDWSTTVNELRRGRYFVFEQNLDSCYGHRQTHNNWIIEISLNQEKIPYPYFLTCCITKLR